MEFWSINFPFFAFTNIIRKSVWILFSNDFKGWQNTATNFDLGTDKYELFFKEKKEHFWLLWCFLLSFQRQVKTCKPASLIALSSRLLVNQTAGKTWQVLDSKAVVLQSALSLLWLLLLLSLACHCHWCYYCQMLLLSLWDTHPSHSHFC